MQSISIKAPSGKSLTAKANLVGKPVVTVMGLQENGILFGDSYTDQRKRFLENQVAWAFLHDLAEETVISDGEIRRSSLSKRVLVDYDPLQTPFLKRVYCLGDSPQDGEEKATAPIFTFGVTHGRLDKSYPGITREAKGHLVPLTTFDEDYIRNARAMRVNPAIDLLVSSSDPTPLRVEVSRGRVNLKEILPDKKELIIKTETTILNPGYVNHGNAIILDVSDSLDVYVERLSF